MGYYTGSGVVTGGGVSISNQDQVISGGTLIRQRMTTTRVTVKAGVSLATAQGNTPSSVLKCGDLTCGDYYWPTPNKYSEFTNYSYSRIGDSSLYALTIDYEKTQMRLAAKNGAGTMDYGSWSS